MAGEQQDILSMSFDADDDGGEVVVALPGAEGGEAVIKPAGEKSAGDDDPVKDLKSQFASMTQRLSQAEIAAQSANQQATEATQRAARAETALVGSQLDTVLSGIAAADAAAETAEREYTAAFEAGDGLAMARAQRKMAAAEAQKIRLQEAKDDLTEAVETRRAQLPQPGQKAPPRAPQGPQDPVERFIVQGQVTPRSAAWIRQHPEFVTDPKVNARVMAAHNLAVADDVEVESDDYFERINAAVGGTVQKKPEPKPGEKQPGTRPSSAAAAGGNGGGALNGGGTEVKLTRREALSATDGTLVWNYDDPTGKGRFKKGDPIGLQEMARRKYEGQRAGLYDKSLSE